MDYLKVVDSVYAMHFDAVEGFSLIQEKIKHDQREASALFPERNLTAEQFNKIPIVYVDGTSSNSNSKSSVLVSTYGEYTARTAPSGSDYKTIGNACLVLLYQYWDDHCREKISDLLGVEKNKVMSDVMGDIRHFRNSIIHHRAIATQEVEKCIRLKWFRKGDEIFLTPEQFQKLIDEVRAEMDKLIKAYCT